MFFRFEADFVDSLRCIPMIVRYKLDTCGVKLKLSHWHSFNIEERQILVAKPCGTPREIPEYKELIQNLVVRKSGNPASELYIDPYPPWEDSKKIYPDVEFLASEYKLAITIDQWASLTPLQRFALIKLSRPSHENNNFFAALVEFNLITTSLE